MLKIQEAVKNEEVYAIGIDLGTTNSLVAAFKVDQMIIFTDEEQRHLLPSVVRLLPKQQYEIGYDALLGLTIDPANTIYSAKRLIGMSAAEIVKLAYTVRQDGTSLLIETEYGLITPVEILAKLLQNLYLRAAKALSLPIVGAVVTVPAYFDDAKRQAVKDACEVAQIKLLRLINEPTAAAIAYGKEKDLSGLYVVYDLGGGTFDISILRINEGIFEVLATGGDPELGGNDLDRLIVNKILQANQLHLSDISAQCLASVTHAATLAKEELSYQSSVEIHIPVTDEHAAISLHLTRDALNQLIAPLIDKTLEECKNTLSVVNLEVSAVEEVILVGGSTRTPYIQEQVAKLFGKAPRCDLNPDTVVVEGAAYQARSLVAKTKDLLLLDVVPLSLGLETMGGLAEKIIERNTKIPVVRSQIFTTAKDNQTGMSLHVVQGERELVQDLRSLARFELTGLPLLPAGGARIEVIFSVNVDGLLMVSAKELNTGIEANIKIKPSYGLGKEAIDAMLYEAQINAISDLENKKIIEVKLEAKQLIDIIEGSLVHSEQNNTIDEQKSDVQQKNVQKDIACAVEKLKQALDIGDLGAVKLAMHNLEELSKDYLEQRFNSAIKTALTNTLLD